MTTPTPRERALRTCKHFTGIMNKACAKGIAYADVRDASGSGPYKFPCLSACDSCLQREYPTPEEVDAEHREFERHFNGTVLARPAILKTKQKSGAIDCPLCGTASALRFAVASNGHVHAKCDTKGCLSWME